MPTGCCISAPPVLSRSRKDPWPARRDQRPVLREIVRDPASTRILIVYQEPINVESTTQTRHAAMAPSEASCILMALFCKSLFSPIHRDPSMMYDFIEVLTCVSYGIVNSKLIRSNYRVMSRHVDSSLTFCAAMSSLVYIFLGLVFQVNYKLSLQDVRSRRPINTQRGFMYEICTFTF